MARTQPAPRATKVAEIRWGDTVLILTGKDAGKQGTVDRLVAPDRVVVDGINMAKRHTKPRARQGRNDRQPRVQQGGIIDVARPLHISNVMVVCPSCHRPTRVGHDVSGEGKSVRVCRHCGEPLPSKQRGKS
jgi:large subunit ribosomal protein L24